jgi:hypothetical protein
LSEKLRRRRNVEPKRDVKLMHDEERPGKIRNWKRPD